VGSPAGTHLSSLINGAYTRLSRGSGGYISSPCRASANPHPLSERRMLGYPLRTARVHGRPPVSRRLRSAFGRVLRCHRAADADDAPLERAMNTSIPSIGASPHSSPSMSRKPRLSRARSPVLTPFVRWPAPSLGAGLFCCESLTNYSGLPVNARNTHQKGAVSITRNCARLRHAHLRMNGSGETG
jgi:hypothetical protein